MAAILMLGVLICSLRVFAFGEENKRLLAFPGAEGGGKFATGARAVEKPEIYHVTTLAEKGNGSFSDAISKSNRIIVFDVGGTVCCDKRSMRCKGDNLTILGQTAPGDGITVEGSDFVKYGGNGNIIMRYLKIRPGDRLGLEVDGISMQYVKDIIVDHCSVSWAIDEQVSILSGNSEDKNYSVGRNITIQNCIMSEALNLSVHQKGEHGYGSIFGSDNSTLYHSLYAHNVTRNPAIYREIQNVNVADNIIYDWKSVPSYGAQANSLGFLTYTPCSVNYVNNFYRYGPSTISKARSDFYSVSWEDNGVIGRPKSSFYFSGNVIDGVDNVNKNNIEGIKNSDMAIMLDEPIDLGEYDVTSESAVDAYNSVLDTIGSYIPKRDAIDAKVIADVKNGTGHIINSPKEVGGYIKSEPVYRKFEISEDWKKSNNMGEASENDIVPDGKWKGYTWIEAYVFDMEKQFSVPTNPEVVVHSPAIASNSDSVLNMPVDNGQWKVISEGQPFRLEATAIPKEGTKISKIEVYDGDILVDTMGNTKSIDKNYFPSSGTHYYTIRVYNDREEATNSPTAIVCVNPSGGDLPEGYNYDVLGNSAYRDVASASVDEKGVFTVGGSGTINSRNNCGFMYCPVKGDFDISVKVEEISRYMQGIRAGLMVSDKLSNKSRIAMVSNHLEKMGENISILTRTDENQQLKWFHMTDKAGNEIGNSIPEYDPGKSEYRVPKYLRIQRRGDVLTFSVSDDGLDWTNNPRQPCNTIFDSLPETLYVGLAAESNSGTYPKQLYSMPKFSNLRLIEYNKLVDAERWKIGRVNNNVVSIVNDIGDGEKTPDGKKINLYAVFYENKGGREIFKKCVIKTFTTDKSLNTYDISLNTNTDIDADNLSGIRLFLWDDCMRPLAVSHRF